jgi:HEAT repeat protein
MPHTPPDAAVLARAAELRSTGFSWDTVAARLLCPADEAREWPLLYSTEWQSALHAAERRLVAEASAESVLILRQLLRSEDEKVRRDAARSLIDLRLEQMKHDRPAEPPPPVTSDTARFVAFLEGHTHEQLAELVAACRRSEVRALGRAVPEEVDGAD